MGASAMSDSTTVTCPRCQRDISAHCGRYALHVVTTMDGTDYCAMSKQLLPTHGTRPVDYRRRADVVLDLAHQMQDSDTAMVWDYLTAMPGDELQRLLVIALAAIDIDQPVDRIFGWVYDLPVARAS